MNAYGKSVGILFVVFVVANGAYLHRVPGLLGDEASEGENVHELLRSEKIVIEGERSYIGPFIDYMRVPFVLTLGYTPLALRAVMFILACTTFLLAARVLQRYFGETPALFALAFGFFAPIYLTQARLGWAITLFPFFAFLILFMARRPLITGLITGVSLSNHILFLPTIVAILPPLLLLFRRLLSYWPAVVGFIVAFAMQFWILLKFREDQGDIAIVAQSFWERVRDLPKLLPHVLSGSSYIASYTGVELSSLWQWIISVMIIILALVALFFGQRKKVAWLWFLGLIIQTAVLLYMIDRFSLRYFFLPVMGRWILAGVGLGTLATRVHLRSGQWVAPVVVALGLVVWSAFAVLMPFLKTGGSTAEFSLGNRLDSAAALVDTRPLLACLRGAGPVSSENIHIWNRLQFLSHQYSDLHVIVNDDISHAKYLVQYRDAKHPELGTLCPELVHFRIL